MLDKRAQTILEYGVLVSVLVIALVAMNLYIKRSLEGKYRESMDSLQAGLYEPGDTVSNAPSVTHTHTKSTQCSGKEECTHIDLEGNAHTATVRVSGYPHYTGATVSLSDTEVNSTIDETTHVN